MASITADIFLKQTLLVGLTYFDDQDKVAEQVQVYGKVIHIDLEKITITLETPGGETWYFPFWPKNMMFAPRGEYLLHSTNQKITDPDFIMTLMIYPPDNPSGAEIWEPGYAPFYSYYEIPDHWELTRSHDEDYLRDLIEKYGDDYLGKHLLIGISNYEYRGDKPQLVNKEQFFGEIIRVSHTKGITCKLQNGEFYTLPPDLTTLEPAGPGEYHLHSTNETVHDPDYISVWTATKPRHPSDT